MSENTRPAFGWNEDMESALHEKIKLDLKTAMLTRDNDARDAIRMVMGEYPKLTVSMTLESGKKTTRVKEPNEITNEELLNIIRGLVKSEKVMLEARGETSTPYLEHLSKYLPKMVEKEDIISWIEENIDLSKFKTPMQAVGPIMKHFGKLADGKLVQEILKGLA